MIVVKKINRKIINALAAALKRRAVIVYPTDTAYALGCDATNAKAVAMIFRIKGRPKTKGLPIIVADKKMAEKYFFLSPNIQALISEYWPGPLSIVFKARKTIVKAALEQGTAAVRVPASEIARKISKALGRPLIATSANLSGAPACYSARAFLRQVSRTLPTLPFQGREKKPYPLLKRGGRGSSGFYFPDLILDTGALARRRPSTIVRFDKKGKMRILRRGTVKI